MTNLHGGGDRRLSLEFFVDIDMARRYPGVSGTCDVEVCQAAYSVQVTYRYVDAQTPFCGGGVS